MVRKYPHETKSMHMLEETLAENRDGSRPQRFSERGPFSGDKTRAQIQSELMLASLLFISATIE
jgi:hypothetical protein